ncbi:hypothetical protein A6A04_10580 [Paramagnetospirillum marisnigri]|uniref:Macrocin-O-methyltransferase n=2 Tax=Paramagnetospirillum marisnigri TaxID=1285242 RepID=A0A178MXR7_9PROT|nr:hypothetical protein A6A04_10580 [Paramagnetospirillum marisnigri]
MEQYRLREAAYWQGIQEVVADAGLGLKDVLQNVPAFWRRRDVPRFLANYELFKMVVDLPGSVAEVGVFRGAGLMTWTHLLETFIPGDRLRRVFGFDHFQGYDGFSEQDGDARQWLSAHQGGDLMSADRRLVDRLLEIHDADSFCPGVPRALLIAGDVTETLPRFVAEADGVRFCLIHLDVNVHQAVRAALDALYPRLVPGGIVALTAYGSPPWEGEASAVEQYFGDNGLPMPAMATLPFSPIPRAYFRKPL